MEIYLITYNKMIKCINFEISKKLSDLGLLDNIETEYYISEIGENILYSNKEVKALKSNFNAGYVGMFKTLTLEEAIDFLPNKITKNGKDYHLHFNKNIVFYLWEDTHDTIDEKGIKCYLKYGEYLAFKDNENIIKGNTLLEATEKMIEYLLDYNLLGGE